MKKYFVLLVTILLSSNSFAATYTKVLDWTTIQNGQPSTSNFNDVVDGQTGYFNLSISGGAITRVDNIGGIPTATTLVTPAQWFSSSNTSNLTAFYGFGISGDYLQFAETSSSAIWRVNKTTGEITPYASKSAIGTYTGLNTAGLGASQGVDPVTGEQYFFDNKSKSILRTIGSNQVTTVITNSQLASLLGVPATSVSLSGGFDFDDNGILYFGGNNALFTWNTTTGSGSTLFSTSDITALTNAYTGTSATFGDVFHAPDGNIYFTAGTGSKKSILSFDPRDTNPTLSSVLNPTDLAAGIAGSNNVYSLTWYDGRLAFNVNGASGLYATVPEPGTILLLCLAGMSFLGFQTVIGRRKARS